MVARATIHLTVRLPEPVRAPWSRTNHAGHPVTLLEGPVAVVAALAGALSAGPRGRAAAVLVVLAPGVLGGVDDLAGDRATKGLRGHLTALTSGRVTTGAAKIIGIGAVALLAVLLEQQGVQRRGPRAPALRGLGVAADTVVIAGSANLINLFDLRPGRALKVVTVASLPLLGPAASRPLASALLGSALALAPEDLAGTAMLGDCGANALGGLLGLTLTRAVGAKGALVAAGGLTALTLASEKVSFTRVIESTPGLRQLDEWGRRR